MYATNQGCMFLSFSLQWSTVAILRDSAVAVAVRTRPRAIPQAMITMRKSIRGFPFLTYMSMVLRLAPLRPARAQYYWFSSRLDYLSPALRAITWVSNYRFSITHFWNWIYMYTPSARELSALLWFPC